MWQLKRLRRRPARSRRDDSTGLGRYSAQEDVVWDQLFARQSRVLPGRVGDMSDQRVCTVSRTSLETIADVDRLSAIAKCIVAAGLEA